MNDKAKRTAAATAIAIAIAGPAEGIRRIVYFDPVGIPTVCMGHTGPDIDKNKVYSQAEAANATLTFTGTLTATRDIVVPLVGKRQWTVYNGTGQSLRFIGASGTGITVATVMHAIVRSDGTNIVRVTADT